MSDAEPMSTSITEEPTTSTTSITSDATIPPPESQTVSDTDSTLSTSPSTPTSLSFINKNESTTTTTDMDSDSAVVPTSVSSTDSAGDDTPTQTETQSTETTTTSAGDDNGQEDSPPTSSTGDPPPTSTSDPAETKLTSEGTPTQTEESPTTNETGGSATIAEEPPTTTGSSEVETMTTSESSPTQTGDPPVTTGTGDSVTTAEDPPITTVSSDPSTEPTQTESATTTTSAEDSPTTVTSEGTSQPTQTEVPPVTTTTSESTSVDTTPTSTDLTTSGTDGTVTTTPPDSDQRTAITTASDSSPTSVLESASGQGTVAAASEANTEPTSATDATFESNQVPTTTLGFLSGTSSVSATDTATATTVTGTGSGSAPLSVSAITLSPLLSPSIVSLTATQTLTSGDLTITTRLGSTLTITPTDTVSTLDASGLNILTQVLMSEPERARLDLSSTSVPIATVPTTEFVTSTLSGGDTTLIPTRTRTTTVTGSGVPTYTLQPNAFERNKGAIIGVIIVAALLAGIGIFVGIWLCRRRKRKVEGRRYNPSPVGDVTTGRVLIPGYGSSLAGDRERGSGRWRPPLVEEFGDEERGDIYTRPSRSMSQRSRGTSIRPVTSYRDRDGDSGDVRSITSGGQASTNTMHFGTSLLSFDGPGHPQYQHYQPNVNPSRFSGSSLGSSEESAGTVRTASLISLSAEPTPLDGQFPRSDSSAASSQQHGEIPIISPFADAFSISHHHQTSSSSSHGTPTRSQSLGSQNSGNAQSLTSLEQDRGWREIEIQDPSNVPRPRGGNPSASSLAASPNPFLYEDEDDEDEESPPPSLMTQMSRISLMSQQQQPTHPDSGSTSSLLNPPTRPQFRGRLTDLIQSSHPPTLPFIPFIVSPALTDVTEESYLGSSYHYQPEGLIDTRAQRSEESLLDHVDYTRPISMAVSGTDSQRESMADHRIVFSRMSATETETSSTSESLSDFEARMTQEDIRENRDDEDPFQDPQSQRDLRHDASPVLMVLQRAAASRS
ncbi:hypothetical protein AAF712_014312 [Marasmius tenuissimus]|uniref:Uncharacterized protein n=1 Tax=Marasmius tenuissimus TaxID=585030 RepID=A0ABR2ZC97_9AGAR